MLAAAIAAGSEDALADAYQAHAHAVFDFSRCLVGSQVLAEDVVQDVFVRFWNQAASFDPERGSLRSYLLTLTYGRSIDVGRSEGARARRETRDSRLATATRQPEGIEDLAVTKESVHSALEHLQDSERDAIALAYFGDHSYKEVAELLHVPEGTVKTRIRAGLAHLRDDLTDEMAAT